MLIKEMYKRDKNNNMQFNAKLTARPIRYTGPGGVAVGETESVRNLSIYMRNNASFCVHVAKFALKCRWLTGWALRTL